MKTISTVDTMSGYITVAGIRMQESQTKTVRWHGYTATITPDAGQFTVYVNGAQIGTFAFSPGHDGLAAYSNSFGVDCFQCTKMGSSFHIAPGCPMCYSKRSMARHIIDRAITVGLLH
jgi:hypothetical protein